MLIDTHAHLSDARFDEDRQGVIDRALAAGVGMLVEIADSPADWTRARELCRTRPGVMFCALGLHPYHAEEWRPGLAGELLGAAGAPEVVAVGEVGLDYARCTVPRTVQMEALRGMLAAAEAARLPVVLHCREAFADLMPVLRERFAGRAPAGRFHGVVHCFSGTEEEARECAALGFALGADGPVTYPKNEPLRRALVAAGLGAIVLETDSPYLPPQSKRGKRCEPADVADVAARLAEAFGVDAAALARATTVNARALYGLPG